MENQAGDIAGLWGFFLWSSSVVMVWLNQNVSAVVALTAIGGLLLSAFSAWMKYRQWQEGKSNGND